MNTDIGGNASSQPTSALGFRSNRNENGRVSFQQNIIRSWQYYDPSSDRVLLSECGTDTLGMLMISQGLNDSKVFRKKLEKKVVVCQAYARGRICRKRFWEEKERHKNLELIKAELPGKMQAVVKTQAVMRGFLAQRRYQRIREEHKRLARRKNRQGFQRKSEVGKFSVANAEFGRIRQIMFAEKNNKIKRMGDTTVRLQATVRGFLDRRKYKEIERQQRNVVQLQAAARGFLVRVRLTNELEGLDAEIEELDAELLDVEKEIEMIHVDILGKYVVRIQAIARGLLIRSRCQQHKIVEERKSFRMCVNTDTQERPSRDNVQTPPKSDGDGMAGFALALLRQLESALSSVRDGQSRRGASVTEGEARGFALGFAMGMAFASQRKANTTLLDTCEEEVIGSRMGGRKGERNPLQIWPKNNTVQQVESQVRGFLQRFDHRVKNPKQHQVELPATITARRRPLFHMSEADMELEQLRKKYEDIEKIKRKELKAIEANKKRTLKELRRDKEAHDSLMAFFESKQYSTDAIKSLIAEMRKENIDLQHQHVNLQNQCDEMQNRNEELSSSTHHLNKESWRVQHEIKEAEHLNALIVGEELKLSVAIDSFKENLRSSEEKERFESQATENVQSKIHQVVELLKAEKQTCKDLLTAVQRTQKNGTAQAKEMFDDKLKLLLNLGTGFSTSWSSSSSMVSPSPSPPPSSSSPASPASSPSPTREIGSWKQKYRSSSDSKLLNHRNTTKPAKKVASCSSNNIAENDNSKKTRSKNSSSSNESESTGKSDNVSSSKSSAKSDKKSSRRRLNNRSMSLSELETDANREATKKSLAIELSENSAKLKQNYRNNTITDLVTGNSQRFSTLENCKTEKRKSKKTVKSNKTPFTSTNNDNGGSSRSDSSESNESHSRKKEHSSKTGSSSSNTNKIATGSTKIDENGNRRKTSSRSMSLGDLKTSTSTNSYNGRSSNSDSSDSNESQSRKKEHDSKTGSSNNARKNTNSSTKNDENVNRKTSTSRSMSLGELKTDEKRRKNFTYKPMRSEANDIWEKDARIIGAPDNSHDNFSCKEEQNYTNNMDKLAGLVTENSKRFSALVNNNLVTRVHRSDHKLLECTNKMLASNYNNSKDDDRHDDANSDSKNCRHLNESSCKRERSSVKISTKNSSKSNKKSTTEKNSFTSTTLDQLEAERTNRSIPLDALEKNMDLKNVSQAGIRKQRQNYRYNGIDKIADLVTENSKRFSDLVNSSTQAPNVEDKKKVTNKGSGEKHNIMQRAGIQCLNEKLNMNLNQFSTLLK